jgi:hypothetical protein
LGCYISYLGEPDVNHKTERFKYECHIIRRNLENKTRMDTQTKFYKTMAMSGSYACETDHDIQGQK